LQFHHKKKKTSIKSIQTHTYTFTIFFPFFFFFTSTLQNTNSKQLNKNYITQFQITKQPLKNLGIAGKAFCTTGTVSDGLLECKTVAARLLHAPPHWRRMGSRVAVKIQPAGEIQTASSLLSRRR
jgi:hypothetical protein